MGEKKKLQLITLDKALELSNGYFKNKGSIKNLICRGKLQRYGPPKRVELDYSEFMEYLGQAG